MKEDRTIKLVFCVLFLVLLVLPNMIMLFRAPNAEKPFPELDPKNPIKSIKKIDNYYTKEFGLKSQMVNVFTSFKNDILNEDPLPNRVVTGKDGWYFLGNFHNKLLDDGFGNYGLSDYEFVQIKNKIQSLKEELTARGVEFYIVVPPNKHRVYSENLPYQLQQGETRLQALNSYLKKEIDFEIIDLRDTLVASKSDQLLYYKTNTHWNDIGAFIGYQKTINAIDPTIPKADFSDYTIEHNSIKRGDITEMINLKSNEPDVTLNKKTNSQVESIIATYKVEHFKNYTRNKTLIMHRDSFTTAWIQFFNESFGETMYLRGYSIDYKLIDDKKPDVLIFEVIERNLSSILLQKK